MNKNLPLFLLLTLLLACTAAKENKDELLSIQIIDRNGMSETISAKERLTPYQTLDFQNPQPYKQVLRIYSKDEEGKTRSKITSYHQNGQIFQYLEGRDTRANGNYLEWHQNGKLKIEATIIEGPADLSPAAQKDWVFDQISRIWNEGGKLIAEISYQKGVLEGESKYYYTNEHLARVIPFSQDEEHGEVCEYQENGKLLAKTFYERGEKMGPSLGFWENETPSYIENYENNKLSTGIYWKENGEVLAEVQGGSGTKAEIKKEGSFRLIEIQKGVPNGKIQDFTSEGELLREFHIKNSRKQGEEIEYYLAHEIKAILPNDKPLPKLHLYWDEDHIHGTVKTWYPNGKLESQKEMHQNKKSGMSFVWYKEGSILLVEEYDNDLLIEGSYYRMNEPLPVSKISKGEGIASLFDNNTGQFLRKIKYAGSKPQE